MRATYVQPDENLTPLGQWIAARMPHWVIRRPAWSFDPHSFVFRVFGFKPYYRFCIFDYTRSEGACGRIAVRLSVMGVDLKKTATLEGKR